MKCCGQESGHVDTCAAYWHERQRDEVRARVEVERELNNMVTAVGTRDGQLMNAMHELAEAEDMLRDNQWPIHDTYCDYCKHDFPDHKKDCRLWNFLHPRSR